MTAAQNESWKSLSFQKPGEALGKYPGAHASAAEKTTLFVVPTPSDGRLLETDLQLLRALASTHELKVLADLRDESSLADFCTVDHPLRMRSLAHEAGGFPRLLYLLRADLPGASRVLLLAERYPGVVLVTGGGLLEAYRELYLYRDDTPDFALELGRQLGEHADGVFRRTLLGVPSPASEERDLLVRGLANRSLAVVSDHPAILEELENLGTPNRARLLPAAYELKSSPFTRSGKFLLTLFGERIPERAVQWIRIVREILSNRDRSIEIVLAEPSPRRSEGLDLRQVCPSPELLGASDAVLVFPEGASPAVSAAFVTSLQHGAVTLAPTWPGLPELQDAAIPLRTGPDCAEELIRVLERLMEAPKLRDLLSRSARDAGAQFPTQAERARELSRLSILCERQRPEHVEPLRVWRDILGIRMAEMHSLNFRSPEPETRRWITEAARQMQCFPGGAP